MTLVKFSSGNKPPVKGIIDVPMKLKDLIKEMRHQGVDIFPDCDSHCYIEGLPLKVNHFFKKKNENIKVIFSGHPHRAPPILLHGPHCQRSELLLVQVEPPVWI